MFVTFVPSLIFENCFAFAGLLFLAFLRLGWSRRAIQCPTRAEKLCLANLTWWSEFNGWELLLCFHLWCCSYQKQLDEWKDRSSSVSPCTGTSKLIEVERTRVSGLGCPFQKWASLLAFPYGNLLVFVSKFTNPKKWTEENLKKLTIIRLVERTKRNQLSTMGGAVILSRKWLIWKWFQRLMSGSGGKKWFHEQYATVVADGFLSASNEDNHIALCRLFVCNVDVLDDSGTQPLIEDDSTEFGTTLEEWGLWLMLRDLLLVL